MCAYVVFLIESSFVYCVDVYLIVGLGVGLLCVYVYLILGLGGASNHLYADVKSPWCCQAGS